MVKSDYKMEEIHVMKAGVAIQYSTQDQRFINAAIEESKKFADKIVVTCFDKFFDGAPENIDLIKQIKARHPDVEFVELRLQKSNAWYAHSEARTQAYLRLKNMDYIIFTDSDEIPDGEAVDEYLSFGLFYHSYKLANYVYFKDVIYQANELQDSILCVQADFLNIDSFKQNIQRDRDQVTYRAMRMEMHQNKPLYHHYSWAKSKSILEQKIKTFGHNNDRNWQDVLDQLNSFNENSTDPVWGYDYTKVKNKFNL